MNNTLAMITTPVNRTVNMTVARFETRLVTGLIPHPDQDTIWGDKPTKEYEELKASIKKIGLSTPILIDQNNQIISGHHRWRACQELGFTEIPVLVLDSDCDEHFIASNLYGRRVTLLDRVRIATTLFKKEQALLPRFKRRGNVQLRKELGEMLDVDERTISRYLAIAKLPMPIQLSVSHDCLTQSQALKIQRLSAKQQSEIAARIDSGEDAHIVAQEYLNAKPKKTTTAVKTPSVTDRYAEVLDLLADYLKHFKKHSSELVDIDCVGVDVADLLKDASHFFGGMSTRVRQGNEEVTSRT